MRQFLKIWAKEEQPENNMRNVSGVIVSTLVGVLESKGFSCKETDATCFMRHIIHRFRITSIVK